LGDEGLSTTVSVLEKRVRARRFRSWAGTLLGIVPVAAALVAIGAVIQLPGVGGGMQIASVLALTELFKLPVEPAAGFALLIWAGSSLVAVRLGVPCLFHEGLSWRRIQQLREESGL
jgi:hypothetical protein